MTVARLAVPCLALLAASGCSALAGRGGDAPLRPVSMEDDDAATMRMARPLAGWAERQQRIFERAWREIRADLAYEEIDSFRDLDAAARRDVLAMRRELEMAREAGAAGAPVPARD